MTDGVDPIRVAGDGGEVLDETDDGAIEIVADGDGGLLVHVDTDTEFGERVAWIAGHRGKEPEELVTEAIEEFLGEHRADGGEVTIRCENGHEFELGEAASATFDGSRAEYQCPTCGAWSEGPPPG